MPVHRRFEGRFLSISVDFSLEFHKFRTAGVEK